MTTYTLNDLLYAKGTSEPVRQMLLSMAEKIEQLEARLAQYELEYPENFINALKFDTALREGPQPDGVVGDVRVQICTDIGWIRDSQLEAIIAIGWMNYVNPKENNND